MNTWKIMPWCVLAVLILVLSGCEDKGKIESLEKEKVDLLNQINVLKTKGTATEKELTELKEKNQAVEKQTKDLTTELGKAQMEANTAKKKVAELSTIQMEANSAKQKVADLGKQLERAQAANKALTKNWAALTKDLAVVQNQIISLKEQVRISRVPATQPKR